MPPRKPAPPAIDVPPGPIALEIRVDGKIKFLQRVHTVTIDQQDDQAVITGVLRLPAAPARAVEKFGGDRRITDEVKADEQPA